MLNLLKNLSGR